MTHQLTLQLPDEIYEPLARQAQELGQSVEAVAQSKLSEAVLSPAPGSLLRKWAGAFDSGLPDVATRHHEYLGEAQQANLHEPDLFYAECANTFWKQVQRGNCTPGKAAGFLTTLLSLPLQRVATFDLSVDALAIALAHHITAYDGCYVALANRLNLPLIT